FATAYVASSDTAPELTDRLFVIGNGDGDPGDSTPMGVWADNSDAFTILKNGQVGIGIDNFETNTTGELLQVGDRWWTRDIVRITNNVSKCTIDETGIAWPSDERLKHYIAPI